MMRSARVLSCCAGCLLASAAHAAGFAIDVQGGRATGLGGAYVAIADDPSSMFYNPAGLVGRRGFEASIGASLIAPLVRFAPTGGEATSTVFNISPPPHLYLKYGLHERVAFGVAAFSPFGSSSRWPEGWSGRFRSTGSQVSTYYLQPTVSVQLHDFVDAGLGVHLARGTVLLQRDLDFVDSTGSAMLGGGAWGWGMIAGAQVKIVRGVLDVGVMWRSGTRLEFEGRAHFDGVPTEFQDALHDQALSSVITLPDTFQVGVGFRAFPRLRLALDGRYMAWSTLRELDFRYETSPATVLPKNWRVTWSVHAGAEYDVSEPLSARAGLVWDPTPSPSATLTPDLADSDRVKASVGAGYSFGAWRVDGAYQLVVLTGASSTFPGYEGAYSGTAHVVGVTLGYAGGR